MNNVEQFKLMLVKSASAADYYEDKEVQPKKKESNWGRNLALLSLLGLGAAGTGAYLNRDYISNFAQEVNRKAKKNNSLQTPFLKALKDQSVLAGYDAKKNIVGGLNKGLGWVSDKVGKPAQWTDILPLIGNLNQNSFERENPIRAAISGITGDQIFDNNRWLNRQKPEAKYSY